MALRQLAAPFDSYDELVGIIRHRLAELGTTCESTSALAGLTETHLSKLINPGRTRLFARMSLTVILQALGIRLIAVTDDEAYAPLRERLPRAAVTVPIEERPKPERAKRPVYDPDEPHPLPVRSRPRFGRGHALAGRAQRGGLGVA